MTRKKTIQNAYGLSYLVPIDLKSDGTDIHKDNWDKLNKTNLINKEYSWLRELKIFDEIVLKAWTYKASVLYDSTILDADGSGGSRTIYVEGYPEEVNVLIIHKRKLQLLKVEAIRAKDVKCLWVNPDRLKIIKYLATVDYVTNIENVDSPKQLS